MGRERISHTNASRIVKVIFVLILLVPVVYASDNIPMEKTPEDHFRDDNLAMGIDHSKPNAYLAYRLHQKLLKEKGVKLGYSSEQADQYSLDALGLPPGHALPAFNSTGNAKMLVFLVDFPEFPLMPE
jgi:hypothetical protein